MACLRAWHPKVLLSRHSLATNPEVVRSAGYCLHAVAVGASDKSKSESKSGGTRALLNDEHMHVSCAHVVRA
eukprot:3731187-Prymnesium_polylepis.1